MIELLAAALAVGFFGSLHCIGMCGGLVGTVTLARPHLWWPGLLAYQTGRIGVYAGLGLIAGALGGGLSQTGWFGQAQQMLSWLAGGLMILFALYLGGWLPDPFSRLSRAVAQGSGLSRWLHLAATSDHLTPWLMVGLLNGLLPCGLVYAGLALALTTDGLADGALTMTAFGLGTLPAMLMAPALMHKLTPTRRAHTLKIGALLLIVLGVLTLFRVGLHSHHEHTHATPSTTPADMEITHTLPPPAPAK